MFARSGARRADCARVRLDGSGSVKHVSAVEIGVSGVWRESPAAAPRLPDAEEDGALGVRHGGRRPGGVPPPTSRSRVSGTKIRFMGVVAVALSSFIA